MFNYSSIKMPRLFYIFLLIFCFFSCKDEVILNFSETQITDNSDSMIEINIPKAEGKTEAAKQINTSLTQFVNTTLNIEGNSDVKTETKESIVAFNKAAKEFKTQIGKALFKDIPKWEVLIDGEVVYKNEYLASIAMNSSINTGGAHSNLKFQFFNFDIKTGKQLTTKDLINDVTAFTNLASKYFERELLSTDENRAAPFNTGSFKLPENLGFSDEGVIIFFDSFNTATNNVIEFTIPYVKANDYLNF